MGNVKLTRAAIFRPVTTLMVTLALVFLGILSLRELPVQNLPEITFPAMYYTARVRDADLSPEKTNDEITRPFEKMVASLPGIREMHSTTRGGFFWGYARFQTGTDMRFRVIELQEKVNKWSANHSREIMTRIVPWSTEEFSGRLIDLILSVPEGKEFRISSVSDLIRRKIRSIDGISGVDISGEMHPHMILETERDRLLSIGMEVSDLVETVNAASGEKSWLGNLPDAGKRHNVMFESRIETLEDLLSLPVDKKGIFSLESLVSPRKKVERSESVFRFNGKKSVRVRITKEKDKNTIRMARMVRSRIGEIRGELPPGFELTIIRDQAEDLEKMIHNIFRLAAIGALLAMCVVYLFVRSLRVSLVVVTAVPVSILVTFNLLYAAGFSINLLSLLGLAVGVGMLVDSAIVVVENIFRHWRKGRDPRETAWIGSREVIYAIIMSTATNLVVFVSLLFIDERTAMILKEMALTLVFTMTMSLLAALTLVPMLAAKVLEATRFRDPKKGMVPGKTILSASSFRVKMNPWQRPNRPPRNLLKESVLYLSKISIRHPIGLFVAILVILFITIFASGMKVALQRFHRQEKTWGVTLYGRPPLGSTLEEADQFFREKEKKIQNLLSQSDVFESFSTRFSKEGGEINLRVAEKYRTLSQWEFMGAFSELKSGDTNSGFRFRPFGQAAVREWARHYVGGRSTRQGVTITGENLDALLHAGSIVKDFLEKEKELGDVELDTPQGDPEVHFHPDMELFRVMKADPRGISSFFRSRERRGVQTSLVLEKGDVERRVTIRVLVPEKEREEEMVRQTLAELRKTQVPLLDGGTVPLERLGSFTITHSVPSITKKNRQRHLTVGFNFISHLYRPGMEKERQIRLKKLQKEIVNLKLPTGVSASMSGTLEEAKAVGVTWKKMLALAILAVYLVMAFAFGSLTAPLVILVTLPLASIGGIWGVIFLNATLDEVAMMGSIILAGLVVNNGILLVEYARQLERRRGFRRTRALMAAVSYRFRPILMTTLTTILGLMPILLSREAEKEARSLVAVLIGGLIASGLLSLVVVPALYNTLCVAGERIKALVFRKKSREKRKMRHFAVPELSPSSLTISVRNISKIYPRFRLKKLLYVIPSKTYPVGHRPPEGTEALRHLNLEMETGMFGLLGPNGAGKSTLMKIITGIIEPTYGVTEVAGMNRRFHREEISQLISYLPQNFGVYKILNIDQYLNLFASMYGMDDEKERRRRIDEVIELAGLSDVRAKSMKRFSGGMRQRAGVAQFLLNPRPIIIVDEPTAGLDPVERVKFRLLLSELARTRIVILSTHIVEDITSSCRKVAILNRGNVIYQGSLEGVVEAAGDLVWDLVRPAGDKVPIQRRQIIYRKYIGDDVLYHYASREPVPGSKHVAPSFEDAYVAMLLLHDARFFSAGGFIPEQKGSPGLGNLSPQAT